MLATAIDIPYGDAGIADTLRQIVRVAEEGSRQPPLILWAQDAIRGVPARDADGEARAILYAVRRSFRYTKDPTTAELVKTPEVLLGEIRVKGIAMGDCDDYVGFLLAALFAVGIDAQPVVVSEDGGTFGHVLVRYRGRGGWTSLDPITSKPPGWFPGFVKRAASWSGDSFHPLDVGTAARGTRAAEMGTPAIVAQPRVPTYTRPAPLVGAPASASPYPAMAGCGGSCCDSCASGGSCSSGPTDAVAQLDKAVAPYTNVLWWVWGLATLWHAAKARR